MCSIILASIRQCAVSSHFHTLSASRHHGSPSRMCHPGFNPPVSIAVDSSECGIVRRFFVQSASGSTAALDLPQLLPVQLCAVLYRPDRPHSRAAAHRACLTTPQIPPICDFGVGMSGSHLFFLAFPTPLPPHQRDCSTLSQKTHPTIAGTRGTCLRASTIAPTIRCFSVPPHDAPIHQPLSSDHLG